MRVVLDTNVLLSAIFFGGTPGKILSAWKDGKLTLVLSPDIFDEYRRVGQELAERYGELELSPVLALIARHAELAHPPDLDEPVGRDPDDDKFLACALAADVKTVISGRVVVWTRAESLLYPLFRRGTVTSTRSGSTSERPCR